MNSMNSFVSLFRTTRRKNRNQDSLKMRSYLYFAPSCSFNDSRDVIPDDGSDT
jgi:hypothetical protein